MPCCWPTAAAEPFRRCYTPPATSSPDFQNGSDPDAVRPLVFTIVERHYDLLLGLRRPNEWTTLRPRALAASLGAMRDAYAVTIADVELELDGERETGSVEVEERHVLSRTVLESADQVLVVARADLAGVHRLVGAINELVEFGVSPTTISPILNGAPRSASQRARFTKAVSELTRPTIARSSDLVPPTFVPWRTDVERAHQLGLHLPKALTKPLAGIRLTSSSKRSAGNEQLPERVMPGSLSMGAEALA
jgi:hypothetical protein